MIDTELLKDIITVSDMLGVSERDFVNAVIEQELAMYRDPLTGKINSTPGEFWENYLECTLHPETEQVWKPCFILYDRTIFTYPYVYVYIIADGKNISVPSECVRMSKSE